MMITPTKYITNKIQLSGNVRNYDAKQNTNDKGFSHHISMGSQKI